MANLEEIRQLYRFNDDASRRFLALSDFQGEVRPELNHHDPPINAILGEFIGSHEKKETRFHKVYLPKSIPELGLRPKLRDLVNFRNSLTCTPGGKNAYMRSWKSFYNWLYSSESGYDDFKPSENPVIGLKLLKVPERIMPSQDEKSVEKLIKLTLPPAGESLRGNYLRNTLLVALFINTGGRLSEVASIHEPDIDWANHRIKDVIAKGDVEVFMAIGDEDTEALLKGWILEHRPKSGETIWGINKNGIKSFFQRLEMKAGFKANPHSFRRGFASILKTRGIPEDIIQTLGHWKSLQMVTLYTKSVKFEHVQQHYRAPTTVAAFQSAALPAELSRRYA